MTFMGRLGETSSVVLLSGSAGLLLVLLALVGTGHLASATAAGKSDIPDDSSRRQNASQHDLQERRTEGDEAKTSSNRTRSISSPESQVSITSNTSGRGKQNSSATASFPWEGVVARTSMTTPAEEAAKRRETKKLYGSNEQQHKDFMTSMTFANTNSRLRMPSCPCCR